MKFASIALLFITIVALAVTSVQTLLTLLFRRRGRFFVPGPRFRRADSFVSILKPVCGLDDELQENLESFTRIRGIDYEVVVSVADPDDPALAIAEGVRRAQPGTRFRIVIGGDPRARGEQPQGSAAGRRRARGEGRHSPDLRFQRAHRSGRPVVVRNVVVQRTLKRALDRQIRWNKIRYAFSKTAYASEFLVNPLPFAILTLRPSLMLAVALTRIAQVALLGVATDAHLTWRELMLAPLQDLLQFGAQFVPYFDDTVTWRGCTLRISQNTELVAG